MIPSVSAKDVQEKEVNLAGHKDIVERIGATWYKDV
jgi:hypothetical protein